MPKKPKTAGRSSHVALHGEESSRNTRARLLQAGKSLFALRGYDATSVKEIAEHAEVNVSLVSYHFGGKENLYRAILLEFGQEKLALANRVLQTTGSIEEFRVRAQLFADEMLRCHLGDPDLHVILHRALELDVPVALDVFCDTFLKVFEAFARFITAAQKRGFINPRLRAETLSGLLFGALNHAARTDGLNEKLKNHTLRDPAYRAEVVEHFLELAFPTPRPFPPKLPKVYSHRKKEPQP